MTGRARVEVTFMDGRVVLVVVSAGDRGEAEERAKKDSPACRSTRFIQWVMPEDE